MPTLVRSPFSALPLDWLIPLSLLMLESVLYRLLKLLVRERRPVEEFVRVSVFLRRSQVEGPSPPRLGVDSGRGSSHSKSGTEVEWSSCLTGVATERRIGYTSTGEDGCESCWGSAVGGDKVTGERGDGGAFAGGSSGDVSTSMTRFFDALYTLCDGWIGASGNGSTCSPPA